MQIGKSYPPHPPPLPHLFDIGSRGSVLFRHWFDEEQMHSGTPEVALSHVVILRRLTA